jgi:exopolysaccharide biosynthesis polyprenyl glycosylphosphotransferase
MFAGELRKQKVLFALVDAIALFSAFAIALSLHDPAGAMARRLLRTDPSLLAFGVIAIMTLWVLVFRACDLYGRRNGGLNEIISIVKACSIASLLTLGADFLVHVQVSRITALTAFGLSMPLVLTGRILVRECVKYFYSQPTIATPLVIVGFNSVAQYLCDQIREHLTQYELLGFLDDSGERREFDGLPIIGTLDDLGELAKKHRGLEAAIALPDAPFDTQQNIVRRCEENRVRWWIVPWLLRSPGGGVRVEVLGMIPLLSPRGSNLEGLNFAIKRSFDLLVSLLVFAVASPFLAIVALAIWLFDGSPILFRQTRVGIRSKRFEMLKFRTMRASTNDAVHRQYVQKWIGKNGSETHAGNGEANGSKIYKLTTDDRITSVGRVLRRFSLDELPQIINVIRGDMSLIGPRPALPYETELYESWHHRRLDVVPGITGLWQISGRNHLSFDEMVRLDVQYMENWSFTNDLRILAQTLPVLLRGDGM